MLFYKKQGCKYLGYGERSTTNGTNNNNNNNNSNQVDEKNKPLDPQPSIETISQALVALYNSDDSNIRTFAQFWLTKFQTLPIAWDFCPKLILETNIFELQYFGASTIEAKLKKEWSQLPIEMKANILTMVTQIVQNSGKLSRCVVTRVCIGLSITVMYTYPKIWKNPILDIIHLAVPDINKISLENPSLNTFNFEKLFLVIEFLSILSQELTNQTVSCLYNEISKEVSKVIDHIFKFLLSTLHLPSKNYRDEIKVAFKAMAGWMKYQPPKSVQTLRNVIQMTYNSAINDNELVESLVTVLEGAMSTQSIKNYSNELKDLHLEIVERSINTLPKYFKLANAQGCTAKSIFNLFVQFLQTDSLLSRDTTTRIMELVVSFSSVGDIELNSLLFSLIEDFQSHSTLSKLDPEIIKLFFIKIFDRFREISTLEESDGEEVSEEMMQFRMSAADSLRLVQTKPINKVTLHSHLICKLNEAIEKNVMQWQVYESIIYYLTALSENNTDFQQIPLLFSLIPKIPVKSLLLVKSSIKLVGCYPQFLREHTEYLEKVIFDLIPAFSNADLLPSAGLSFLNICSFTKIPGKLLPHIDCILNLCESGLREQKNNSAIIYVYEGLLHIMKDSKDLLNPFHKLISPVIQNLCKFLQENQFQDLAQSHKNFLVIQLSILNSVTKIIDNVDDTTSFASTAKNSATASSADPHLQHLQQQQQSKHPIQSFLHTIIPILGQLLKIYTSEFQIIELICVIYRWSILFFKSTADFIEEILVQVTQSYVGYALSYHLQVINAIPPNQKSPDFEMKHRQSISLISKKTLDLLKTGVDPRNYENCIGEKVDPMYQINFSYCPELTKEYLSLISSLFKSQPRIVDHHIISTITLYIIYNLLEITDQSTTKHCMSFISTTLLANKEKGEHHKQFITVMDEIVKYHGRVLMKNLMAGVTSKLPTPIIHSLAGVFHSFCSAYPTLFRKEAQRILYDPNFMNNTIDQGDKHMFLSEIQRIDNKNEHRIAIHTFSILCNGCK
eukprot:gene4545-5662_t